MKSLLLASMILSSVSAFACGEAQLHSAKIVKIEKTASSCKVMVEHSQVDVSPVCNQINDAAIFSEGVEVGLNEDGSCKMDVGQKLSGVIVEKDGVLYK